LAQPQAAHLGLKLGAALERAADGRAHVPALRAGEAG